MCLAQGPQRSDAGEARTRGPSVSSRAPYHWVSTLGLGSKGLNILFLKCVILHIKVKGMEHRAQRKFIFCPYTNPLPLGSRQTVKFFFCLKVSCCISKEWSMEHHASTHYILTHTLSPWRGVKKSKDFIFLEVVMLHIKLKGMKRRAPFKHIFCPQTHPR